MFCSFYKGKEDKLRRMEKQKKLNLTQTHLNIPKRIMLITHYQITTLFWQLQSQIQVLTLKNIQHINIAKIRTMKVVMEIMISLELISGGESRKIPITTHFFSSNVVESDYGVKNVSEDNLTENPYDHTNTGTYQTTIPDNEYNTISFNP